ncbi:hypothetical protein BJV78DRAFT_1217615 [Lactifluus subvellereus]|nr:hypothetical protein BJV78DRAFT_1217615 [Lactifluus subvellereus]
MSFLRTFWRTIYRPRFFVGTDLEGNRFYEYPSLTDEPLRTRRRIQYKVYDDMWDYVGSARRLPVQWVSWLSHTRPDPPTLEVCPCVQMQGCTNYTTFVWPLGASG